ncbi:MAG: class A beta-lactamase [Muribaculaceae bacterium]|nr:class A beta-lactamase [Muribaculaceae bacterium]
MKYLINCFVVVLGMYVTVVMSSCGRNADVLESEIRAYIADKDARIGVAVMLDGEVYAEVNGCIDFPMLSVYKFPQALAVADYCRRNGLSFSDTLSIAAEEIEENTWSPMRERYGVSDMALPISELLGYTLQQSDNNACDVLFRLIGGTAVADSVMKSAGFENIVIASTEAEMHDDVCLCYQNRSTPLAMARLLEHFDSELRKEGREYEEIAALMETCETGMDRLAGALPGDVVIGHKTGTGDRNSQGRIIGINDVGYVHLSDGRRYVVAVFIADSAADAPATARMIADLSAIIYRRITK